MKKSETMINITKDLKQNKYHFKHVSNLFLPDISEHPIVDVVQNPTSKRSSLVNVDKINN